MRNFHPTLSQAFFAVLMLLIVGALAETAAAQYVYTPIPGLSGNTFVEVDGVNDSGAVVGFYSDLGGHSHGFLWTGGTNYTTFDFPGAVGTFPTGINNAGVIVGSWDDTSGFCHAFSGTIGNFTTLNIFGSPQTFAEAINNKGEIVGAWEDANSIIHGFTDINGTIASFDFPGSPLVTFPLGVNDFGQIVGSYTPSGPFPGQDFILTPNAFPGILTLALPDGSTSFSVGGIDDAGDIAGVDLEQSTSNQFVVLDSGTATFLTPFGFSSGFLSGLNSSQISSSGGDIVGNVNGEGFLARGPVLIDPVPDLVDAVTDAVSPSLLQSLGATGRRFVKGVAADGVTEAVIRIPAQNAGDQFTIKLSNDQNSTIDPNLDGALGNPGDTSFTQGQITVSAINVTVTAPDGSQSQVPFAFAVYHAPIDFVRQNSSGSDFSSGSCPYASAPEAAIVAFGPPPSGPQAMVVGPPQSDDQLGCRMVLLQVQDLTQNTSSSVRLPILRPPVVMIHGLWDNWKAWDTFSPLWVDPTHADKRFSVGRVSYDNPVSISFSIPAYSLDQLQNVEANSLGFEFNAPGVLSQIKDWIGMFKDGSENPLHLPVAGVQADIVAHSMGGDITRTLVLQSDFLRPANFGQGDIHKLITIDTPHLGSPLATALLDPQEFGGCLQSHFASSNRYVFGVVTLSNGIAADGALGDLELGSNALSNLSNPGQHPLPTALIAGIYSNFSALDTIDPLSTPFQIRAGCGFLEGDPLAKEFTSTGWQTLFKNEANDAIVPVSSQLAGFVGSNSAFIFTGTSGYVHSPGTEQLGFSPPSVLDPGDIPNQVIKLLNTPVTQPEFSPINP